MTPIRSGRYEYRYSSLIHLRQRLKLKQREMAKLLDIPANTLSRWENGATKPDAESLAAIYSLAKEHGVTPEFFHRRKPVAKQTKGRSRLIVLWDFQFVPVAWNQLDEILNWVGNQLTKRFGRASYRLLKAFAWESQANETDKLIEAGWRIFEDNEDLIDEIYDHAKSDCGQDPEDTTLVLIAADEAYAELVKELKAQGVRVHLISPPQKCDQPLLDAVGSRRRIPLPEYYSPPIGTRVRNFVSQLIGG